MGGGKVCRACGSTSLDVDPTRGDTVCMDCGSVLEDSVIVSEVQFEEGAGGVMSAVGHFVSSESSGGCRGFGSSFLSGSVKESREITLMNAKRHISQICDQLRLNQHCLDTAFNFYKMALSRQFTRGRKSKTVFAACIYLTCRIEGTPHLLIDLSDLLQISPYQLGRTYVTLTQSLCINVPSIDPCIYVLRYAGSLELGDKTNEVSTTALRIVQRMMKDSIHTGRRPSGICGAALLLASRLHNFNRTVGDIVKIVQVHETTLRKRLLEFGETPSSCLTLKEFMVTDLSEEQDPPSFKAARLKDEQILEALDQKNLDELGTEIDNKMNSTKKKKKRRYDEALLSSSSLLLEEESLSQFVQQATLEVLKECLEGNGETSQELGPDLMRLGVNLEDLDNDDKIPDPMVSVTQDIGSRDDNDKESSEGEELDLNGLDDEELDMYIMSDSEVRTKNNMWFNLNSDYLQLQIEKERIKKEAEDGKPEKKKRKLNPKKKGKGTPANNAGEAIEKMLQEKRISAKINYDVLKSLSSALMNSPKVEFTDSSSVKQELKKEIKEEMKMEIVEEKSQTVNDEVEVTEVEQPAKNDPLVSNLEEGDVVRLSVGQDDGEGEGEEEEEGVMSVFQMFNKHHGDDDDNDDYQHDHYQHDDDYY